LDSEKLTPIASGDPRNIITTVLPLPATYQGTCTIVVNNFEPYVSLRNILIVLMAHELAPARSVDAILHLWYSAAMGEDTLQAVKKIGFRIRYMCNSSGLLKQEDRCIASLRFGKVCVTLIVLQWKWILKWFYGLNCYTNAMAQYMQKRFFIGGAGKDILDLYLSRLEPYHRVSFDQYLETGILLPLTESKGRFTNANP
jgi:Domain of unknown function (DUF4470)